MQPDSLERFKVLVTRKLTHMQTIYSFIFLVNGIFMWLSFDRPTLSQWFKFTLLLLLLLYWFYHLYFNMWTWYWTLGFHKMWEISWQAEKYLSVGNNDTTATDRISWIPAGRTDFAQEIMRKMWNWETSIHLFYFFCESGKDRCDWFQWQNTSVQLAEHSVPRAPVFRETIDW
jgi:hypothetical protein